MFELTSDIKISEKYKFRGVVEAQTVSTWDSMTDTATLVLPQKILWRGKYLAIGDNPILRKGNPLSIAFGLDGKNSKWFSGYLTNIHAGIPIRLEAQDAMFLLKRGEFVKSYKQATLKQLLGDMLTGIVPFEVTADYDLGQIRSVNRPTPAQWLDRLRQDYFCRFWFRDGVLYAGSPIVPKLQAVHKIKYIIQNSLEYVKKEDVKILLKGVIMMPDNTKIELQVGDPEGEVRTLHKYNTSKKEMLRYLEAELETLRYEGYRGSFTTFILPDVKHGDIVILPKIYDLEHDGRYIVKEVIKSVQGVAARQTIKLERRIK